jgi:predicted Zn-dependent peptidase
MTKNTLPTPSLATNHLLDNGLQIILCHKPGLAATVQIDIGVGSVCEEEGQKGYSHLIEHMLFEGTTNRKNAQIICGEIENVGGDINASTSTETTSYYVKVLAKHIPLAIDVLSDMILNSLFEKKTLEKEKSVVLEEIKVIDDQPRYFQWIAFEKELFQSSSYADPVYGFTKDVSSATRESLVSYYKKHYSPNRTKVLIVGDIKAQELEIITQISAVFKSWKSVDTSLPSEILPTNAPRLQSFTKDVQQIYSILGYICPTVSHEDAPVLEVIEAILGKPQSGRLYDEIRNKSGLAYDVGVSYETMYAFGVFTINVVAEKEKHAIAIKKIHELLKMEDLTEAELKNAKQFIEGSPLLELESIHRLAANLSFWFTLQKKDGTHEYLEKIMAVTLADIARVAKKYFTTDITHIQLKST